MLVWCVCVCVPLCVRECVRACMGVCVPAGCVGGRSARSHSIVGAVLTAPCNVTHCRRLCQGDRPVAGGGHNARGGEGLRLHPGDPSAPTSSLGWGGRAEQLFLRAVRVTTAPRCLRAVGSPWCPWCQFPVRTRCCFPAELAPLKEGQRSLSALPPIPLPPPSAFHVEGFEGL